jgi:7-cyano-7-deazaguanine synthase in queuosine biosynthesis
VVLPLPLTQRYNLMSTYHVLWSGGLDSTYLIHSLLNEGHVVRASYCEIINNKDKTIREQKAIKSLCKVLSHPKFSYLGVLCRVEVLGNFLTCFSQMPVWITALLSSGAKDADYLALGYVLGDDAISYLEDIQNIWNAYGGLSKKTLPLLQFPLKKVSKEDIIRKLPLNILKLVTWCENSDVPCGKCPPCWHRLGSELFGGYIGDDRKVFTEGWYKSMKDNLEVSPTIDTILQE